MREAIEKLGIRRPCISCVLRQASLLLRTASYILFCRGKWDGVSSKTSNYGTEVSGKLTEQCYTSHSLLAGGLSRSSLMVPLYCRAWTLFTRGSDLVPMMLAAGKGSGGN